MKIRIMLLAATAALWLGGAFWTLPHASAQPLWDVVYVTLPYPVTVGDKILAPGPYTIEQLHDLGSTVLLFYNADGTKFETSAMTIRALDRDTPKESSVTLRHIGENYYIDKVWIQGKDYGYEIPPPDSVKEGETMSEAAAAPASPAATAAASEMPAVSEPSPAPPPPEPEPAMTSPAEPPAPEPQASTDTQQPPTPPADSSANREKRPAGDDTGAPAMPSTSAGWLAMLLSGGTLSGVGLLLRRKR